MKRLVALALLCLLMVPQIRGVFEGRMSFHMGLEFPFLFAIGWLFANNADVHLKFIARIDGGGLLAATFASCVLAGWMIPVAVDLSLLEPKVAALKYLTWLLAGALVHAARRRLTPVITSFFLGNSAWMMATAGLLYFDAEQQLCVNYLVDDQQATGLALLFWGAAFALATMSVLKPVLRDQEASV
ncbi:hypothetical protein [Paucibacter sp. DJ2R-2]|uniref:hypothetical protein n=1 Tax=Paucibacter sp. DJ2R-2 TaxID=2893558 RepID=UPI0021E36CE6|nr:hypothetical protein [Paucibacter sp. DJ2R-2]MCV2438681.1 hypothetical protein [Paucibacter sp. DJ2R-2]